MYFDYEARTINLGSIFNSFIRTVTRKKIFIPHALTLILVLTLISLALLAGVVILYLQDKNKDAAASTVKEAAAADVGKKSMTQ